MARVELADGETQQLLSTRSAAVLVEKLKEFRQSYNRTHGQVCEFLEQALVIEKVHRYAPGPCKTARKREKRSEESDNEEDGCTEQKTWSIKQKLNCWRTVMREVVSDVCPNLQLENQPDINPGLMKHVLDEIRKLKTELAFQHNAILELTHRLESHRGENQRKDRLIEKLLIQSREIRLEGTNEEGTSERPLQSSDHSEGVKAHIHQHLANFDQDDILQFGSIECLRDLHFDLDEMQSFALERESGGQLSSTAKPGRPLSPKALEKNPVHDLTSHSLTEDGLDSQNRDIALSHASIVVNKEAAESVVLDASNDAPSSSTVAQSALDRMSSPTRASGQERWNNRRLVWLCGRLCCVYAVCKVMQRGTRCK